VHRDDHEYGGGHDDGIDEDGFDPADLGEGLDPEGPSAADLERFGGETITCPVCGVETYDQAELCHNCGAAQGLSTGPNRTLWTVLVGVVLFGVVAILMFG